MDRTEGFDGGPRRIPSPPYFLVAYGYDRRLTERRCRIATIIFFKKSYVHGSRLMKEPYTISDPCLQTSNTAHSYSGSSSRREVRLAQYAVKYADSTDTVIVSYNCVIVMTIVTQI